MLWWAVHCCEIWWSIHRPSPPMNHEQQTVGFGCVWELDRICCFIKETVLNLKDCDWVWVCVWSMCWYEVQQCIFVCLKKEKWVTQRREPSFYNSGKMSSIKTREGHFQNIVYCQRTMKADVHHVFSLFSSQNRADEINK